MALGTIAGTIAGSAAKFGLSKLFGGKSKGPVYTPPPLPSINAGGFQGKGGEVNITPERQALTDALGQQFLKEANAFRELGGLGVSGLRALRLKEVDDALRKAVGNLKENLAKRRIQGSSFGQNLLSQLEIEGGRQRERVVAESALASLALVQKEAERRRAATEVKLQDLNMAKEIGLKLSTQAAAQLRDNAAIIAELEAKRLAGAGQFAGQLIAPIGRAIGGGVSDFFGGGGTASGFDVASPWSHTITYG
jgi:hypothetical protein